MHTDTYAHTETHTQTHMYTHRQTDRHTHTTLTIQTIDIKNDDFHNQ